MKTSGFQNVTIYVVGGMMSDLGFPSLTSQRRFHHGFIPVILGLEKMTPLSRQRKKSFLQENSPRSTIRRPRKEPSFGNVPSEVRSNGGHGDVQFQARGHQLLWPEVDHIWGKGREKRPLT